jgi:hypothetical protein
MFLKSKTGGKPSCWRSAECLWVASVHMCMHSTHDKYCFQSADEMAGRWHWWKQGKLDNDLQEFSEVFIHIPTFRHFSIIPVMIIWFVDGPWPLLTSWLSFWFAPCLWAPGDKGILQLVFSLP